MVRVRTLQVRRAVPSDVGIGLVELGVYLLSDLSERERCGERRRVRGPFCFLQLLDETQRVGS